MGHDHFEQSFPCLCGNGHIIAGWDEHDVYPSRNRLISWSFDCDKCQAEYLFYKSGFCEHLVHKADAERHRDLVNRSRSADEAAYQAAHQYEQKWVGHALSLPSKAAIHRLFREFHSYKTVLQSAKDKAWVEAEARKQFRANSAQCLVTIGISDPEVTRLAVEANQKEETAREFLKQADKEIPKPHLF